MQLTIGLLGCGVVGNGFLSLLNQNRDLIARRSGLHVSVRKVLVRDKSKRAIDNLTDRAEDILGDPEIDLVVELMGGLEPARSLALQALSRGKHLVTANKLMLAESGGQLFEAARERSVRIGFEASVGGAIPIIRALSQGLAANQIESMIGILNSTSNFILHRMEAGDSFDSALRSAQVKGFAEADPSLDVDGPDAAQKLAILAWLGFGRSLGPLLVEGIRGLDPRDLNHPDYVVRHVGIAWRGGLRVHPALLPRSHPLAGVRDEDNAVLIQSDSAGDLLFTGKGAGSLPTASAVLSDVIDIALGGGCRVPPWEPAGSDSDFESRYYIRLVGVPGILGVVSTILEAHGIGVRRAVVQSDLAIFSERTQESRMIKAIEQLSRQPILHQKPVLLRVVE
jgi:homoserine dehydrogenase